jgi:arsenate reductase (thioredoxin)
MTSKPSVLFVCRHNSGRSQIAPGLMRAKYGDIVTVRSRGIEPAERVNEAGATVLAERVNEAGATVLAERGIDITDQTPRHVTEEDLRSAGVVVTLVDGVELAEYQGVSHERWTLPDSASWDIEHIRPLIDDIERRVDNLAAQIRGR